MSDSEEETRVSDLLTDLSISTISMNGSIEHIDPDEREDIKRFKCVDRIVEISNNFHRISTPEYEEYKRIHKKKQRDTEKSKKKNKKNKKQVASETKGDNTHQSSQITFVIKSDKPCARGDTSGPRHYKIKLFRKGAIQIPGVVSESYDDIGNALNLLVNYLRLVYKDDRIRMTELYTSMKNYICRLVYDHFRFNLNKLRAAFDSYKRDNPFKQDVLNLLYMLDFPYVVEESDDDSDFHSSDDDGFIDLGLPKKPLLVTVSAKKVRRYSDTGIRDMIRIMCGHTQEQIAEVIKDTDKSVSSVSIKFYRIASNVFRVARGKDPKRTTIKIMQSGKVNFEGGNGYDEIAALRLWLMKFVRLRQNDVLGNVKQPYVIDPNSSDDSDESMYADFVPAPRKRRTRT